MHDTQSGARAHNTRARSRTDVLIFVSFRVAETTLPDGRTATGGVLTLRALEVVDNNFYFFFPPTVASVAR